jgi:hypothetical protein
MHTPPQVRRLCGSLALRNVAAGKELGLLDGQLNFVWVSACSTNTCQQSASAGCVCV